MDVDKSWIPKCIEFLKKIEQNNYSWIIREDAKNDKSCRLDAAALFCKLARIFDNHHQFNKKKMADAVLRFKDGNNYYKDAPKKKRLLYSRNPTSHVWTSEYWLYAR